MNGKRDWNIKLRHHFPPFFSYFCHVVVFSFSSPLSSGKETIISKFGVAVV
jgi:hypothetical protein